MLSISATESAHSLATELDGRGIAVIAKPNTLLGRLVATTYIDYNPVVTEAGFAIDTNKMVQITESASTVTGFSEHAARMEESADFLARKLEGYLLHARSVAGPFIDAYAARLAAAADMVGATPSAGANIRIRRGNNLLVDPALRGAYVKSEDVVHESIKHDFLLPEMEDAQLIQLMHTGSPVLDVQIDEHFGTYPEGWLKSLYQRVFRCGDRSVDASSDQIERAITGRDNVDSALAVFLLARRLWNAPPEGTQMALAQYEDAMVELRNQAAKRLCYEYDSIIRDGNSGILVTSVRKVNGDFEIEVNQDQYDLYLKQGGSADALFGNQLQNNPLVLTADILENKEVYEAAWTRHYNVNKSYFDQRMLTRMREAVYVEWLALAGESTHDEFPLGERHVCATLVRRLSEKVSLEDLNDLPLLALKISCDTRFRNTADRDILLGMRRAKVNNPVITSLEAATISIMEYLYNWVGDNMEVVSANKVNVFSAQDHQHV